MYGKKGTTLVSLRRDPGKLKEIGLASVNCYVNCVYSADQDLDTSTHKVWAEVGEFYKSEDEVHCLL